MKDKFKSWENLEKGTHLNLQEVIDSLSFNVDGLIPAIAQQFDSKKVLMMAWMNKEALLETLKKQRVCYYSRSRQCLWRKGESSGHHQFLKSMHIDCDGDTLLLLVDQTGQACHTMRNNCFYFMVDNENNSVVISNNSNNT